MILSSRMDRSERGYVLLTLLLMVALLIVVMAAVLPTISFEIRRDREEELIHRGVQYSRAIRTYYKKFGRYPTRIEELESSNNLRFLRKRYKDPITHQDFKLLHFGEVKMAFNGGLGGGIAAGVGGTLPGVGANTLNGPGGFGAQPGVAPVGGSFGAPPGGMAPTGFGAAAVRPPADDTAAAGTDQNRSTDSKTGSSSPVGQPGQPGQPSGSGSSDQLSGQTFGGGPVVGVVSGSKKDSIREFNHKKKYSEWQFIYDPGSDRGGLLSTPNQPPIQGFGAQPGQNGQQGTPNGAPFGPQPGQANPPGQTNPNSPVQPGMPIQTPPNPPDQ